MKEERGGGGGRRTLESRSEEAIDKGEGEMGSLGERGGGGGG